MQIKFQVNLSDIWIIVCLQTEWVWLLHKINNISASESSITRAGWHAGTAFVFTWQSASFYPSVWKSDRRSNGRVRKHVERPLNLATNNTFLSVHSFKAFAIWYLHAFIIKVLFEYEMFLCKYHHSWAGRNWKTLMAFWVYFYMHKKQKTPWKNKLPLCFIIFTFLSKTNWS